MKTTRTKSKTMKKLYLTLFFFIFSIVCFSQQTQFVKSSDGLDIAYQVYGKGEITLIFIHGWCCDKSYWKEQIKVLRKDYKIIAIDLPGHGESGLGREKFTIPMFAEDVTSVIKHLKLNKIILIGHSMGVNVMLEAAILNLDKTLALFTIDGYSIIPKILSKEELAALEKRQRAEWIEDDFEPYVYNWVRNWHHQPEETEMIEKIAKDMSQNNPRAAIESAINFMQWFNSDYPNSLKSIGNIPVISIASESKPDVKVFRNHGVNFYDFRMDGLSHFLMITHPEEFNEILTEQLHRVINGDYNL